MDSTWMDGPIGREIDGSIMTRINDPTVKGMDNLTDTKISSSTVTWMDIPISSETESLIGIRTETYWHQTVA